MFNLNGIASGNNRHEYSDGHNDSDDTAPLLMVIGMMIVMVVVVVIIVLVETTYHCQYRQLNVGWLGSPAN